MKKSMITLSLLRMSLLLSSQLFAMEDLDQNHGHASSSAAPVRPTTVNSVELRQQIIDRLSVRMLQ